MVRNSERQKLLKALELNIFHQYILENDRMMEKLQDDSSDSDDDFDSAHNITNASMTYLAVHSTRYINRAPRYKKPDLSRALHLLENARPRHFLSEVRMSREVFWDVLSMFASSNVFRPAGNRIIPIKVQFLIAFHRFGTYGNGVNFSAVSDYFGISGTTISNNYTCSPNCI